MKKLFQSSMLIIPIVILLSSACATATAGDPVGIHIDFSAIDPEKIHGRYLLENLDQFDQAAFEKFLTTVSWGLTMPHCMVALKVGKDRADQLSYYSPVLKPLLLSKKNLKITLSHLHNHFSPEERLAIANEYLTYYLSFGGDKDAIQSVHELTLKKLEMPDAVTVPSLVHQIKHDTVLRAKFERAKYELLTGLAVMWIQREQYEKATQG